MTGQSPSTRKQCDFTKLMIAGYELELNEGNTQDFYVTFHGPESTAYQNGVWKVHVTLPDDYPFASPSIGFMNKILHPNIDEASGSVCLDVINQTWTPIYSLVNIFDIFLPQLLMYPNASDPLNADAGSLMLRDKAKYEEKVRDYVRLHASEGHYLKTKAQKGHSGLTSLSHHDEHTSSSSTNHGCNNVSTKDHRSSSPASDLSYSDAVIDEDDNLSDP